MRLRIRHATQYSYDGPPGYIVQRLHLEPSEFASQRLLSWSITAPGMEGALRYVDGYGNKVHLLTSVPDTAQVQIVSEGEVETEDSAGVVRGLGAQVPQAIFLRRTPSTEVSPEMEAFVSRFSTAQPVLEFGHELMRAIHERVAYETGTSHADTTAAEAFTERRGVCQDHAHIMVALARRKQIPARYVTGYLVTGVGVSTTAAHAWAEIAVPDLGWVGFDAANGQCPNESYVRLAAGHDAMAVAPVKGSRRGGLAPEHLTVEVSVEISQQ
jgi:transglutaminase-like putative cysteine protease